MCILRIGRVTLSNLRVKGPNTSGRKDACCHAFPNHCEITPRGGEGGGSSLPYISIAYYMPKEGEGSR